MKMLPGGMRPVKAAMLTVMVLVLAAPAIPVSAQDTLAEARLRRIEAEVRALQRQVFPGSDGKFFPPQIAPPAAASGAPPAPGATSPVTDLLTRMEAVEAQLKQLTAQGETNANRIAQLETRLAAASPPAAATGAPAPSLSPALTAAPTPLASAPHSAADSNLSAMTGGASAPRPVATPAANPAPSVASHAAAAAAAASAASPGPSAQRLAAVRAVAKPQTGDPGDDEYSYGYHLWEAKFYPEAEQQLKLMIDRYPRHSRISYARNLLGRAYLDDAKPREAAAWFLQNYQAGKTGERAPDSLILLAEAMSRLKDTSRACIAISEFASAYPREAAGRLKEQYDSTRAGVKCN